MLNIIENTTIYNTRIIDYVGKKQLHNFTIYTYKCHQILKSAHVNKQLIVFIFIGTSTNHFLYIISYKYLIT